MHNFQISESPTQKTIEGILLDIERDVSKNLPESPGLLNGTSGVLLLYINLYHLSKNHSFLEKSLDMMELSVDKLNTFIKKSSDPYIDSLGHGITGIGWILEKLNKIEPVDTCLLNDFEEVIHNTVKNDKLRGSYDLFYGVLGKGVYFLERDPDGASEQGLKQVVDTLWYMYEKHGWQDKFNKKDCPSDTVYNLGLAHGIAGITSFLSKLSVRNIYSDRVDPLLQHSLDWLLRYRNDQLGICRYPSVIVNGDISSYGDLSWCYGDLGVAIAYLQAYKATHQEVLKEEAIKIASLASKRMLEQSTVRMTDDSRLIDPCFCHGSAGIAHLFKRIAQATHYHEFERCSHYWIEQTLTVGRSYSDDTIGGFLEADTDDSKKTVWKKNSGLLTGASGVALCLMSSLPNFNSNWDSLFFTDIN
ncbi:Lanthionine biosynthesis cyclase LanC [Fulvivirga imtechensis AK7]|uniref:Lanthionine biosynthesis cyclase LanC n=1 Tax=Fulvivirga imtechensis AK7 TaxID=1237149 RepID=L8K103_9BACT|nr:lanthionine synthetase C family protein [Fulvivirga imtechensis]ELR73137.1 Lanthionine biosynthesis cyclase LanC [Fulvivirga imtechensis AK7]